MKLVKFAAAAVLAASSFAANASLLQISGGTTIDIPAPKNDFEKNFPLDQTYNVGGNLIVNATGNYFLTYTLIGYEASYTNSFYINGDSGSVIDNQLSSGVTLSSLTAYTAGQALSFAFHTVQGNATVNNGSNLAMGLGNYNFAVALDTTFTPLAGDHNSVGKYYNVTGSPQSYDAVLFLDDVKGFGTPDDDNHDDLIIGIRIVKAPEPSALLLMGLGLLGLAGARRLKA